MNKFEKDYIESTYGQTRSIAKCAKIPPGTDEDTSDDGKEIERHPKKRNQALLVNNFFTGSDERFKRIHFLEVKNDATEVADPLWILC